MKESEKKISEITIIIIIIIINIKSYECIQCMVWCIQTDRQTDIYFIDIKKRLFCH